MGKIVDYKARVLAGTSAPYYESEEDEKQKQIDMLMEMSASIAEMFRLVKDKYDFELQERITENEELRMICYRLEKKCSHMEGMLKKCVPMHTIIFLIINAVVIAMTAVLLVLNYGMHVYIIDAYYLFCALIIGATLFVTGVSALFEWRSTLNGK